jgi:hypothetical protein
MFLCKRSFSFTNSIYSPPLALQPRGVCRYLKSKPARCSENINKCSSWIFSNREGILALYVKSAHAPKWAEEWMPPPSPRDEFTELSEKTSPKTVKPGGSE